MNSNPYSCVLYGTVVAMFVLHIIVRYRVRYLLLQMFRFYFDQVSYPRSHALPVLSRFVLLTGRACFTSSKHHSLHQEG